MTETKIDDVVDQDQVKSDTVKAKPSKPKSVKKPKIQYIKFKNAHNNTLRIIGDTLRPNELSRSYTSEQAAVVKNNMKPYIDSGWIEEVKL